MRIFLIYILMFCTSHLSASIQSISREDVKVLEFFFQNLLFQRGFAYTLFGNKPMSTEYYDREDPNKPQLLLSSAEGYKMWEKYAHLFPSREHIFLFYEDIQENIYEITLINKRAFHQVVAENEEKFAAFFGPEINSEKLLNLLIQKRSLWNTPMKDRDDLIGILLGFGRHNAELFQKRSEIESCRMRLTKYRTTPSLGYHSVEEELEALNAALQSFCGEGRITLNYARLPGFAADLNHDETRQLKKNYAQQRKLITRRYSRRNALEITLEQLRSEKGKNILTTEKGRAQR